MKIDEAVSILRTYNEWRCSPEHYLESVPMPAMHALEECVQRDEAMRAEVEASASRAERLEKALSAYQAAVNKIDDLIEYSLPMPPETKAALYAILDDLTAVLSKENSND